MNETVISRKYILTYKLYFQKKLGLDLLKNCQVGYKNIYHFWYHKKKLYHSDEMIDSMLWNKNVKLLTSS